MGEGTYYLELESLGIAQRNLNTRPIPIVIFIISLSDFEDIILHFDTLIEKLHDLVPK